jgi:hypothetical protein
LAGILGKAFRKPSVGERVTAGVVAALALALVAYSIERTWFGLRTAIPALISKQQRALESARPAYAWLARQDGRVLAYADPLVYLYTGRPGISLRVPPGILFPGSRTAVDEWFAGLPDIADRHGIDYVLSTPEDYHFDAPERSRAAWRRATLDGGWAKQAFAAEGAVVLRIDRNRASLQ